jgi:hypothetical protein
VHVRVALIICQWCVAAARLRFCGLMRSTRERADSDAALPTRPLWRLFRYAYGDRSPLLVYGPGGALEYVQASANGVRQGDTLSCAMFAISMRDIYSQVAACTIGALGGFGVTLIAVQDDVNRRPAGGCRQSDGCVHRRVHARQREVNRSRSEPNAVQSMNGRVRTASISNDLFVPTAIGRDQDSMASWAVSTAEAFCSGTRRAGDVDVARQLWRACGDGPSDVTHGQCGGSVTLSMTSILSFIRASSPLCAGSSACRLFDHCRLFCRRVHM